MIDQLTSHLHRQFVSSIVYMLQISEYNIGDYVSWVYQTKDFSHIQKRKKLIRTKKAIILEISLWMMIALIIGINGCVAYLYPFSVSIGIICVSLIASRYVLGYGVILPLILINLLQYPYEKILKENAKKKISCHKGLKIGIAGSYGKTSMREIVRTVLSEGKKVAAPQDSINTPLGISTFIQTLKGDEDIVIFELGEYFPGDIKKLCEMVSPDIGIITGINEAHLEKMKTIDNTVKTIYELADFLKEKLTYINGENALAKENMRLGQIAYDKHAVGSWTIHEIQTDLSGTSFVIKKGKQKIVGESSLIGEHQIGPLALAVDLADRVGLTKDQIQKGVAKTKPFPHRLEVKTDASGVITLDDSYNGNPDGVDAVIACISHIKNHRRWYVTPGLVEMGSKKEEVHKEIGRKLAKAQIEKVILIRNSVTKFIEQGLQEINYKGDILWFDDELAALRALPRLTVFGDLVVLQNDWPDQYK